MLCQNYCTNTSSTHLTYEIICLQPQQIKLSTVAVETPTHQGWNFPLNSPLWLAESLYRESESSSNSHSIFEEAEVYVSKSKQSWIGSKSSIYKSLNSSAILFDCNKQIRPLSCRKCVGGVVGSLRITKRLRKSHSLSQTVGYKVLSANSVFSIRYLPLFVTLLSPPSLSFAAAEQSPQPTHAKEQKIMSHWNKQRAHKITHLQLKATNFKWITVKKINNTSCIYLWTINFTASTIHFDKINRVRWKSETFTIHKKRDL